ncbi:MAG: carbohydrate binding family 9 domain-containing protein [Bacteroidales bacterium]|nr:carbohydrate binding family 9 domain-containing protein [Bacteroidales bacterium]
MGPKKQISILRPITLLIVWPILSVINTWSQSPLQVTRPDSSIIFDGVPYEPAWQQISPLQMIMHSPVYGEEPTERTVMKIAYDNAFLYLSGIFDYKDPKNIRAFGKKRDYTMPSCDWFGIILDSFYDRENAVSFWTNPNGLRTEGTIKNDNNFPDEDVNWSWNTFWDVKTAFYEKGWTTEFKIPFSSLRFQVKEGLTGMGIILVRYDAATNEMSTFPAVPPDYNSGFMKPSLTSKIEFRGLKPKKPFYLAPYVTGGIGQENKLNKVGTAYITSTTPKFDAGMDAKYSLTHNLTADLTVNTDFAQVEADDQKINLTRYSLYFPEKRMFFLEKADIFDFSFVSGSGNNLFYSRRIGLYDGNPVRIYGGLRMTGRINNWDVGILDMQTAAYEENPGENFGIARTKRNVFNNNSYVGGMVTSRLGMNGTYNIAYGIDGQFRITGDEYLIVKMAQTFEKDSANKVFDLSPSRFMLQWQRRKLVGFNYDFLYTYSGDAFNPGIGFETKDNYQLLKGMLQYGWLPGENKTIRLHKISLTSYDLWNTATGLHETANSMLTWYYEAKKGYWGDININWFLEDLMDTLALGNNQGSVPPGRYSFVYGSCNFSTSYSHALAANFTCEAGSFYDGWKLSWYANPSATIGTDIELGLTYNLDYINFPLRSTQFTNHIIGFKGLLTLTTKTSFSAFVQYNTAVNKVIANVRFRYNPREGNDFYIVYDEGINTHNSREIPTMPFSSGRTVLLKYTYTFRL